MTAGLCSLGCPTTQAMNFDGDEDDSPKTGALPCVQLVLGADCVTATTTSRHLLLLRRPLRDSFSFCIFMFSFVLQGKYTTMPRHRKAQQPNAPTGTAVHESPIVDELLEVLVIPKEPFRAWGANDVLDIAGNLSALWLLFQTASVSAFRVEATRKTKGAAKSECFAMKAPETKERVSFANLGGDDNDSSGEDDDDDDDSEDDDDDEAKDPNSKAPSLYGTRHGQAAGDPNEIRVDLWHLNAWIHFCVQLFLPRCVSQPARQAATRQAG